MDFWQRKAAVDASLSFDKVCLQNPVDGFLQPAQQVGMVMLLVCYQKPWLAIKMPITPLLPRVIIVPVNGCLHFNIIKNNAYPMHFLAIKAIHGLL